MEPVEGLVEVTRIAACADGDQREQPRIARSVLPRGGGGEAAHLRQGVVEDVGQTVAVLDQVLDGVEPAVTAAAAAEPATEATSATDGANLSTTPSPADAGLCF